jgi:hypothetical protein
MSRDQALDRAEARSQILRAREDLTTIQKTGSRHALRIPETPGLGLDMLVGVAALGYSLVLDDPDDPGAGPLLERRGQYGLKELRFFTPSAIENPTYPGFGLLPTSTDPTLAAAVWDALHRALDPSSDGARRLREQGRLEDGLSAFRVSRAVVATWREYPLPDVSDDPVIQGRIQAVERAIVDGWVRMRTFRAEKRAASGDYKDGW